MTRSSRRRRESHATHAEPEAARGRGSRAGAGAPADPVSAARTEWGAVALVLAAAAWLHRGALSFGFFADDFLFLDQVRQRTLIAALLSRDPLGNFLRPISRQLHFWVASRIAGESPVPFHLANLLYFLIALTLFQRIARRWIGGGAAVVAMAVLALSYTADVPMLWASGSQDLMALTLALAALLLHVRGNRGWAALAYGLALLCKETVLLTPLVAWLLDSESARGRRLRNLAPMAIAALLWAVVWKATESLRPAAATTLHADPGMVPAALLHLVQCAFAFEWGAVGLSEAWRLPSLAVLAVLIVAVLWVSGSAAEPRPGSRHDALLAGLGWAACGALPVAAVAPIWSAYYYLFAMFGAALAVGAAIGRGPRWMRVAALVLFAALNARASARQEFATAPGAWTTQSHVTRFYLERSERIRSQLLSDLRRERPTLPASSTLFFARVPSNIGWQAGDGPLVRWAYRDTSLKSYFLNQFSYQRAQRGPSFFFMISNEHLVEMWKNESPYGALALNMILDDHPESARDALRLQDEGKGLGRFERYMTVWLELDAGRMDSARAQLIRLGNGVDEGAAPEVAQALRIVNARGDTMQAIAMLSEGLRHRPFDPAAHGLMSDLLLIRHLLLPTAQIEAYAARVLAPDVPWSWRRWAEVQLATERSRQGALSLDRYFQLAGPAGNTDTEARYWRDQLRRVLPGGDLAQQALSGTPRASGPFVPPTGGKP
jgi:hypothetical protein